MPGKGPPAPRARPSKFPEEGGSGEEDGAEPLSLPAPREPENHFVGAGEAGAQQSRRPGGVSQLRAAEDGAEAAFDLESTSLQSAPQIQPNPSSPPSSGLDPGKELNPAIPPADSSSGPKSGDFIHVDLEPPLQTKLSGSSWGVVPESLLVMLPPGSPVLIWRAQAFLFFLNHHKWQDAFYSGRVHLSDGQKSFLMSNYSYVS